MSLARRGWWPIVSSLSMAWLKERSQLHRMIADNNTWIFGEEFNLTVDDQSLTEVLRKHRKLIGENIVIEKAAIFMIPRLGAIRMDRSLRSFP
jgi:hypothetical protein